MIVIAILGPLLSSNSLSYSTMVALYVDFKHLPAVISFGQAPTKREVDHRAGFAPDERWFLSIVKQREVQHPTAQLLESPAIATGLRFFAS